MNQNNRTICAIVSAEREEALLQRKILRSLAALRSPRTGAGRNADKETQTPLPQVTQRIEREQRR